MVGGVTLINFQVGDPDTPLSSLVLTGTSSDQFLVPNSNISFSGTGTSRTAVISSPGGFGFVDVTFTVTDTTGNTASDTFALGLFLTNGSPVISSISDISIAENTSSGIINFTVSDAQTPASLLTVTATSSNTALIPNGNIVLGGTDTNRTVRVTPLANQTGSSIITISVTDQDNATAHETFVVTVFDSANMPTITPISDQTINEDTSTGAIAFTLSDSDTPASLLTVTVGSSNVALVPTSSILVAGSGANRTVTVTPAANASGQATITLTVSDGSASSTETFNVNVVPVNDLPTISFIPNATIPQNTSMAATPFTVNDAETDPNSLTITAATNNPFLAPLDRIVIGGTGANRTVAVSPLPDRQGTATITLTVNDGNSGAATSSFVLTVTGPDDAPTITPILDQTIMVGVTSSVSFTISDDTKPSAELFVDAFSSDQTIIEDDDLTITGTGDTRTLNITPIKAGGPVTVTVLVSDGINNTTTQFQVTVSTTGPTITAIADQVINEDASTGALAFTIGDSNTPVNSLTVSAASSNQVLIPNGNIVLGGTGANRTVSVTPVPNASGGPATITVTVSDGTSTATETFDVTVVPVNDAPIISAVADKVIDENTATGTLAFTIGDVDSAVDTLTVTATSNNQSIVPNSNIILGGTGASRTVNVIPAANTSGTATITLTVSDGAASTIETFNVTVTGVDAPPTISSISDQVIDENESSGALAFTIADLDTPLDTLTVTATSNDQTLVPNANIVVAGTGANRTVTVTPAADQSGGPVTITVTVMDASTSVSEAFTLTVNPIDTPPTISAIANQVINENSSTGALAFTVADPDTPLGNLTIAATSNNQTLVPNGNIVLGGSGANRTVTVTPAADTFGGPATITVTVSDANSSATETFTVTVNELPPLVIGDSNHDGVFDSADLVLVFAAGEYEDNIAGNSTWEEGDWNGDGDFNSSDLVDAFAAGTYESGAPATAAAQDGLPAAELVDLALAADDIVSGDDLLDRLSKKRG
jgi:hypothetical protein